MKDHLPVAPLFPLGPVGPRSPCTPVTPGTPINPCSPFTPTEKNQSRHLHLNETTKESCGEVPFVTFLPRHAVWAPVSKCTLSSFQTFPPNNSRKSIISLYTFISKDAIHTRKSSVSRETLEKKDPEDKLLCVAF